MAKDNLPIPYTHHEPRFLKRLGQAVVYGFTGWFGPEQPNQATQPQTAGRRFDYVPHFNQWVFPRRDSGIDFRTLREFADNYDILRLVIETRKDQIAAFEWDIVAKEQPGLKPGEQPAKTPEMMAAAAAAKTFFETPDGKLPWHTWLRTFLEDLFVIDAVALWPTYNGTTPVGLERVDAGTIKIIIDEQGRTPAAPQPAYQQALKGMATSNYTVDELKYFMRNPRNNKVYGYSPVEQILMTINIGLRRELNQLQWFTEGNIPEAICGVPDTWDAATIKQFQKYWDSIMEGNTASRRKMKFVPTDASKILQLRSSEESLKTEFDEWIVRIICYCFSVSPTPFVKQVNRATAQTSKDSANEEGLVPLLDFVRGAMNSIIVNVLKQPQLEFRWNLQEDIDPASQATIDTQYVEHGIYSIDEVRLRKGLEPLGIGNLIWTSAGPIPVETIIDGSAQYLQPPPAPDPGGPPGSDGPPKGDKVQKGVSVRNAPPFRKSIQTATSSLVAQTAARNRRGSKYFKPR